MPKTKPQDKELEQECYDFIQDIIFWYGNSHSPYYKDYGDGLTGFNTHNFCIEMVEKLVSLIKQKQIEAAEKAVADYQTEYEQKHIVSAVRIAKIEAVRKFCYEIIDVATDEFQQVDFDFIARQVLLFTKKGKK